MSNDAPSDHDANDIYLRWRKSTFSGQGDCVEVARLGDQAVVMRDSKDPAGGSILFAGASFGALIKGIQAGALDELLTVLD